MVSKPEHHLGERIRHPRRRTIRSGEEIDQEALDWGEIILEEVPPADEPEEEQREPWGFADESRMTDRDRNRLRLYREFLQSIGEGGGP